MKIGEEVHIVGQDINILKQEDSLDYKRNTIVLHTITYFQMARRNANFILLKGLEYVYTY